ncbi:hypothetical protein GCM10027161_80480 [Microbispora hainanensis]
MLNYLARLKDELLSAVLPSSEAAAACSLAGRSCRHCSSTYSELVETYDCPVGGISQYVEHYYGCGTC